MLLWSLIVSITGGFHALHLDVCSPAVVRDALLSSRISFRFFPFFLFFLLSCQLPQVHVGHSLEKNKRKSQSKG